MTFVYEREKRMRGFLKASIGRVHAEDPAPRPMLDELAVDPAYPEACEALLKVLLREIDDAAPTTVSARLPYDEWLFAALTAAGISFDIVEMHQAVDGNMVRVLDLPGLLRAICAELSARLAAAGTCLWQGTMCFETNDADACLSVSDAGVRSIPSGRRVDAVLRTDHATLLKWVLGMAGFAEFPHLGKDLPEAARVVLTLLFPRLPCMSGPWG